MIDFHLGPRLIVLIIIAIAIAEGSLIVSIVRIFKRREATLAERLMKMRIDATTNPNNQDQNKR